MSEFLFGDLFEVPAEDPSRNDSRPAREPGRDRARRPEGDPERPASPRERRPARRLAPTQEGPDVLSVSELTRRIGGCLAASFPRVWVAGEISNFRHLGSGHMYLSLKDAGAQLSAVIWRSTARRLGFRPRDGLAVIACGAIEVYGKRGAYQLVIDRLEPRGEGALQLAFEELKARLAGEGLFDPARRRPLPLLPRKIAVVTSPDGAAIRDILRVLTRRFPRVHVVLVPVNVQGEESAPAIVRGIELANRASGADVLIVGRGGGSLEDLFAFNTERVARAIAASRIPVIAGVGHETDVTIADFAADLRAPTPSAAAEHVVPELARIEADLERLEGRLARRVRERLHLLRVRAKSAARRLASRHPREIVRRHGQRLDDLALRLRRPVEEVARQRARLDGLARRLRSPRQRLEAARRQLGALERRLRPPRERIECGRSRSEELTTRLARSMRRRLCAGRDALHSATSRLDALSPLRVLERGYSITARDDGGAALTDAGTLRPGDRVVTRLRSGRFTSRVEEVPDDPRDASTEPGREP